MLHPKYHKNYALAVRWIPTISLRLLSIIQRAMLLQNAHLPAIQCPQASTAVEASYCSLQPPLLPESCSPGGETPPYHAVPTIFRLQGQYLRAQDTIDREERLHTAASSIQQHFVYVVLIYDIQSPIVYAMAFSHTIRVQSSTLQQ